MRVTVVIEEGDSIPLSEIHIVNIEGTKNFAYSFEEDQIIFAGGIIFNHEGDMYDLIERVLNGRTMYRKD